MKQSPKKIRVHIIDRSKAKKDKVYISSLAENIHIEKSDFCCAGIAKYVDFVDYILLSEHEKLLDDHIKFLEIAKKKALNLEKQLAKKDKEIESLKGADRMNTTMFRETLEEKDEKIVYLNGLLLKCWHREAKKK